MKIYNKKLFFCLTAMLLSPFSFADNQIVYYDPAQVKLKGVVEIQTFPGPPNYESIQKGDEMERGAYLRLYQPIDVNLILIATNEINEPEKNIKIIQIADINDVDWKKFLKKGKHIQITGTLFHRFTGHHHTRVLIDVKQIEKV